jgi:L-erythro-3,5-diaminohexanoate dehydrogenase
MRFDPCPFGSHRAGGGLPQPAPKLDVDMPLQPNEACLDVELLNLDATSMKEVARSADGDADRIKSRIMEIVRCRGKMHNPATNSGGVLVGRVKQVGEHFPDRSLRIGERICPIVSLSILPLRLHEVIDVDIATTQVSVRGEAIIFGSTIFGRIPADFSLRAAIGLIDIAGAPARTLLMVRPGMKVAILGGGKAGMISAAAARESLGRTGQLVVFDVDPATCGEIRKLDLADAVIEADLRDPIGSYRLAKEVTNDDLFDVVISVTSAAATEGAAILMARPKARVLFFGMATNFQAASLSAEGIGRDVELLMGNGYVENCVEDAFRLVRACPGLRRLVEDKLGAGSK